MLVPVACRFVPYDQWFVTHVDDGSKVKHVKLWILSKCSLVQSPGSHVQRSVSPIVFASSIRSKSSIDSLDDGYNEDDEYSDQDSPPSSNPAIYPRRDPIPGPSSQLRSCPLVDQYSLLSFSTGSVLEDEFTLSWYTLRPYELLEMHPVGIIAPLQRDVLADYIQPYFQARVRILRSVWDHKSGRFEAPAIDALREHAGHKTMDKLAHRLDTLSTRSQPGKKHKAKVDWKARWLVIHQGIIFLCKDNVTNPPVQQFALNTMTALRGTDALERAFSVVTQPRVVCIKFRSRHSGVVSPPSSPSSPISDESKINVQEPAFDSKQTGETIDPAECAYDQNDACEGEGEWIVFDMLDDHAFSSVLRILHRQACRPISSSFVPSSSMITVSHSSIPSPAASSFASYDTIPYPEWRVNTVENARKAGMGDVGKAMAWVLWSEKGLGESLLGNIRSHRQAFSQEMQYKPIIPPDIYCGSDVESDEESEMEWEGWMRDLDRQCRVKQQSDKVNKARASPRRTQVTTGTSLPSPPLSETSPSGSPRVRSPSLSVSHLAGHAQYPNIGDVIQASGPRSYPSTEHLRPLKSTSVSAVGVGASSAPRRRSSTLLAQSGVTRRGHDKGRLERGALPSTGASAHTVSTSAIRSPSSAVRHARSSSNLRVSSSPYGSDAAESMALPGPSSPSRRQSAFMRGVSLRAGKLVRGLESAIDFVDEKTTN